MEGLGVPMTPEWADNSLHIILSEIAVHVWLASVLPELAGCSEPTGEYDVT